MEKTDTRIFDLIKAHNQPAAQEAENAAEKAMCHVYECAPTHGSTENFNYWLLMNFYTYQIVQDMMAKLESK